MRIMYNIYKKGPYKGVIDILKLTVNVGHRFGEHTAVPLCIGELRAPVCDPPLYSAVPAHRSLPEHWL